MKSNLHSESASSLGLKPVVHAVAVKSFGAMVATELAGNRAEGSSRLSSEMEQNDAAAAAEGSYVCTNMRLQRKGAARIARCFRRRTERLGGSKPDQTLRACNDACLRSCVHQKRVLRPRVYRGYFRRMSLHRISDKIVELPSSIVMIHGS